jgi:hypothetical protein
LSSFAICFTVPCRGLQLIEQNLPARYSDDIKVRKKRHGGNVWDGRAHFKILERISIHS